MPALLKASDLLATIDQTTELCGALPVEGLVT